MMNKKRVTITLPGGLYDRIWQIHSETHESLNAIIIQALMEGLKQSRVNPAKEKKP